MCRQCNNPKYIAHSDIYFISYKKYMKEVYYRDIVALMCQAYGIIHAGNKSHHVP